MSSLYPQRIHPKPSVIDILESCRYRHRTFYGFAVRDGSPVLAGGMRWLGNERARAAQRAVVTSLFIEMARPARSESVLKGLP